MLRRLLTFTAVLVLTGGISYLIHSGVVKEHFPDLPMEILKFAYKFNLGITLLFTSTIILVSRHLKEQLGFIFLAGSFVKLGLFLALLKTSGFEIGRSVFLHFFLPYVLCIVIEIAFVIRILNTAKFKKDK